MYFYFTSAADSVLDRAVNKAGKILCKYLLRASPATDAKIDKAFVLIGGWVNWGIKYGKTTLDLTAITWRNPSKVLSAISESGLF